MEAETIGLLHPGEMGAAVGGALVTAGRTVCWASEHRTAATATRAKAAGLTDAGTIEALLENCPVVLSICPPHAAVSVARQVAGFGGCFVDANAVAPSTAREVEGVIAGGGGSYVDGGIIGPPPAPGRPTRLWLSGERAEDVAALFSGTEVAAGVLRGDPYAASALKMCFAAWTKGTAALLLAVRAAARAGGVEDALLGQWRESAPELPQRSRQAAQQAAGKGWRWVGEMEQIAATFASHGLPAGFHSAAADVFARVERDPAAGPDDATLEAVIGALSGAVAAAAWPSSPPAPAG
jgi:3-hydroxyisobutyrate dehydrogenase-like beta-hydroxyacid dehydrogenase